MKILHTSDWHLGQELYCFDRTEEHLSFLSQIENIVKVEQPDALVVSGDIYHNSTPSNSVMRMFSDALLKIANVNPQMKIIITAGNHDSSSRLEITRNIWQRLNVEVIGGIEKVDGEVNFDRHIITIPNSEGKPCGIVVAMPHIFPQSFPLVREDSPRENRQQIFWETLNNRLNEINTEKLPVVMMAHMAISGSNTTGHDLTRGGMDFVDISSIPVDFDYLALGHIHCPQNVDNTRARYCGTPIAVSFDEDYEHSVSIVEVNSNCEPSIKTIPIVNPIPLKTIPSVADEANEVIKLIDAYNSNEKAYLRVNIKHSDDIPHNIKERLFDICKNKQLRFCTIKWENDLETKNSGEISDLSVEELQQMSPIEIAQRFYLKKNGCDMSDKLVEMLKQVINEVTNPES